MRRRLTVCALAALVFAGALGWHTLILRELPEGRVEVLAPNLPAAEGALASAAAEWGWEPASEEGCFVIPSENPFAAPAIRAALAGAGMEAQVLDYAWAPAVVAQSGTLWLGWGAVWGLWLVWSLLWAQGRTEWTRAQAALERQYPAQYLSDAGVRLLAGAIALAAWVVAAILALQWLWRWEPALPSGLLPEGTLFDPAHYCRWAQNAFPDGRCSPCGTALADKLRLGHALAAVECGALAAGAAALRGIAGSNHRNGAMTWQEECE